ncbi:hypothetical protein [Streptomyces angustmyceticus]|uniref:hypothetical protein n=1 Tax=Streptomyces angustmyceticus TaxID=285578 RepID=UPI00382E935E
MTVSQGEAQPPQRVDDVSSARWVEEGAGGFDSGVHALLPSGFETYVRLLHPHEPAEGRFEGWAEVAQRSGRRLHPLARFTEVAGPEDEEPWQGSLPEHVLAALCAVLKTETTTPQQCLFGIWEGWGWLDDEGPRVRLSGRAYALYEGPVDAATALGDRSAGVFFPQAPNLWWPRDRAWCVATDVDLDSTYLGGSARLAERLAGDPRFEVFRVALHDRIG